jgi:hypothetical protein
MITFRVGAFDAEILEKEFAPQFTAEDLVNLGFAQIYLKLMIDGVSSMPFSATTMPPIKEPPVSFRQEVIDMSRKQFARDRASVEQEVLDWHKHNSVPAPKKPEAKPVADRAPDKPVQRTEKPPERPKYTRRDEPRFTPPQPDLPSDDDFVPLKELKPKPVPTPINGNENNGAKKVVNEKSLSELRAVLQSLNKDKTKEAPKVNNEEKKEGAEVREIPEDKLKAMLHVDNNQ